MTTLRFCRVASLLAVLVLGASAASGVGDRIAHAIESERTGRTQRFEVSLPRSYADHPGSEFPVLVLLDGESNLDHASAVAEFLAESGAIPEMIVVGVHAGPTRAQDYAFAPVQDGIPARGERYLEFIAAEVLPFIEREYRAAPLRLISGHSLGGAFVTSALTERPDLFSAYLAQSPYLPGEFGEAILGRLGAAVEDTSSGSAFYYANLGEEPDLRGAFAELGSIVSESSTIRASTEAHPRETHMSTRLLGLYEGLSRFFGPAWRFEGEAGSLPAHVSSLSERYGFDVLYSESTYRESIQFAMGAGNAVAAVGIAKLYARQHGYSPVPHFFLAAARARSGDIDGARAAIRESVERYDADPRREWASLEPSIRTLAQQLGVGGAPSSQ